MTHLVLGLFDSRDDAADAVSALNAAGIDSKNISLIVKDAADAHIDGADNTTVAEGAASGATTGGLIGALAGLLVGIGAITIPGVGAVLIGGPIAAALGLSGAAATTVSGAVTGAVAGGLIGALVNLGVPEESAKIYEERIKAGALLVAAETTADTSDNAQSIMEENGADQIEVITTKA